ncbi:unnamed protein product, partial [Ectocarpus sp. 13 AM-2016]
VVVWPSLPGLQQAAVGVAPPAAPSALSGVAASHHRMPTAAGRGGMLGPGMEQPGLPAGAVPPGAPGDWSGIGRTMTPVKGRRTKAQRANSSGKKSNDPNTEGGGDVTNDRDTMVVLRSACDACHRMKRKCDGLQPCNRCRRRSRPCGYSYKQKSGPPKGSKRKLIAADEDLLENRQSRPKLIQVPTMWPKDAQQQGHAAAAAAAAATAHAAAASAAQATMHVAAGGETAQNAGAPSAGTNAAAPPGGATSPGANGINRLLAVGGHGQQQQPVPQQQMPQQQLPQQQVPPPPPQQQQLQQQQQQQQQPQPPRLPGISLPPEGSPSNGAGAAAAAAAVAAASTAPPVPAGAAVAVAPPAPGLAVAGGGPNSPTSPSPGGAKRASPKSGSVKPRHKAGGVRPIADL